MTKEKARTQRNLAIKNTNKIIQDILRYKVDIKEKLLDLGGGLGFHSHGFSALGFDVTLVEIDQEACNYAREQFGGQFKIIQKHPYFLEPNTKYDIVFCNHVIEHYNNPLEFLRLIHRLLNRQGIAIIGTPNQRNLEYLFRPELFKRYVPMGQGPNYRKLLNFMRNPWMCLDPPRHLFSFSINSMTKLLDRTGFQKLGIITEYAPTQYYAFPRCTDFVLRHASDIPKVLLNIYAQIGIRLLQMFDRKNCWGNNLIAFATQKEGMN